MATQKTYPSWGYWIENGATTFYEAWELDKRSHNHFMFGTILDWIIGYLAGFNCDPENPGDIIISPKITENLTNCQFKTLTVMGEINIYWKVNNNIFTLNVDFSEKTNVTIHLPDGNKIEKATSGLYSCYIH